MTEAFKERCVFARVDRWRQTVEIWSREQVYNESVDDQVAAMQTGASRISMPQDYVADAILQGLKRELHLFVLHAGVEIIHDKLSVVRTAHSADKSATRMSNVTTELDFFMQQQAETMKALKSIKPLAQCSAAMSDQLSLIKKVPSVQAALSTSNLLNDSIIDTNREQDPFHHETDATAILAPVSCDHSRQLIIADQKLACRMVLERWISDTMDATPVLANKHGAHKRQWSMTSPAGVQPYGSQLSASTS